MTETYHVDRLGIERLDNDNPSENYRLVDRHGKELTTCQWMNINGERQFAFGDSGAQMELSKGYQNEQIKITDRGNGAEIYL